MNEGLSELTDKEKEALRLLLAGQLERNRTVLSGAGNGGEMG